MNLKLVGMKIADSAGRSMVTEHSCPVSCGDVFVYPWDIVFGDEEVMSS